MSAANNHDNYIPPDTAAGTTPLRFPVIEAAGTFETKGLDLEWHPPPPLPKEPSKKEPRVKSRWLRKQLARRGRS